MTRAVRLGGYGPVLLLIVATYVLAMTPLHAWTTSILLSVQILTVWLALRTSKARRGLRVAATALFVVAVVSVTLNLLLHEELGLTAFVFVTSSCLYFVAPGSIVRHLAYRRSVDGETLLGALAAYLLIGMAFGFAYRALGAIQAGPFFGTGGDGALSQDLFFSFVTMTTTGYGNLVPAGNPGQSLAVLEALVGQLFLVTAVAKIVGAWRPRVLRGGPGDGPDAGTDRGGTGAGASHADAT